MNAVRKALQMLEAMDPEEDINSGSYAVSNVVEMIPVDVKIAWCSNHEYVVVLLQASSKYHGTFLLNGRFMGDHCTVEAVETMWRNLSDVLRRVKRLPQTNIFDADQHQLAE
jgi:hypothetical protein